MTLLIGLLAIVALIEPGVPMPLVALREARLHASAELARRRRT